MRFGTPRIEGKHMETPGSTTTAPTAPYSAASALAEIATESAAASANTTPPPPEGEAKPEEGLLPPPGEEPTGEEGESGEPKEGEGDKPDELPTLDPELIKLDPELARNPAISKRWAERVAGIEKVLVEAQAAKVQADEVNKWFAETGQQASAMAAWGDGLMSSDVVVRDKTFGELIQMLAVHHKVTPEDLIASYTKTPSGSSAGTEKPKRLDKDAFDTPEGYQTYVADMDRADAAVAAQTALEARLRALEAGTQQQTQTQQQRTEFLSYVDKIAPDTIKAIATADSGWVITKAMVAKALEAQPHLRNRPQLAVQQQFSTERAKHYAKVATEKTAAPMGGGQAAVSTVPKKDPLKYSALDAINESKGGG